MNEQQPIITSLAAVRYALKTCVSPVDWPRIIHVDKDGIPLPRNEGGGFGFIYVTRRAGDPTPNDEDIKTAEAMKKTADQLDRKFIDYIILTGDRYFSFADEREILFHRKDGEIYPGKKPDVSRKEPTG